MQIKLIMQAFYLQGCMEMKSAALDHLNFIDSAYQDVQQIKLLINI